MTNVYAITGAGGYVGGAIAAFLELRGQRVRRLSRVNGYSLEGPLPAATFADGQVEVLVHAAYDFSVSSWAEIHRLNVEGSLRLFDAAEKAGVRQIIFISSLAAYDGCASLYGRGKKAVEDAVLARNGQVIRPGTVFGPRPRGMMGSLTAQVMSKRWIPAVRHPQALSMAHEDDLAALVENLAGGARQENGVPWLAAGPRLWTIAEVLREVARRANRDVRIVQVPWQLVWGGLKSLEVAGLKPSFRSDSVLSLARPIPPEQLLRLRAAPHPAFRDF